MDKLGNKTIIGAVAKFTGTITDARTIEIHGHVNADLTADKVTIGEKGITEADLLVHDAKEADPTLHQMLARLTYPVVTGVIRAYEDIVFEEREMTLNNEVKARSNFSKVDDLLFSGDTYEVK